MSTISSQESSISQVIEDYDAFKEARSHLLQELDG